MKEHGQVLLCYKDIDKDRVLQMKSDMDEIVGDVVCIMVNLDNLNDVSQYSDIINCKVLVIVCSSAFNNICNLECEWLKKQILLFKNDIEKHVVLVTLDLIQIPSWLEDILPRQQVTDVNNEKLMQVFYNTLQERLKIYNDKKIKVLPDGIFKVGNLFYRAANDKTVVEVISEFGDAFPDEGRDFGKWISSDIKTPDGYIVRGYYANEKYLRKLELIIPSTIYYSGYEYDVVGIGKYAFADSYGFQTIVIPESVKYIGKSAFFKSAIQCVNIPDSVECIGEDAFAICEALTEVVLSKSIIELDGTFAGCDKLKYIDIPDSVINIGEGTFSGCKSLMSVIIPRSVKSIGKSAFRNCESLSSIVIPNTVIRIGEDAFCENMTSIVVEEGNPFYDSRDNCNAIIRTATNDIICGCKNIIIPNSIKYIRDWLFRQSPYIKMLTIPNGVVGIGDYVCESCRNLQNLVISDSVVSIGCNAFSYCDSLESITFGGRLLTIGKNSFRFCSNLQSVIIPDSVIEIGDGSFAYCSSLASVTLGKRLLKIGKSVFCNSENLPIIYVPKGMRNKYSRLLDEVFVDRIVEL